MQCEGNSLLTIFLLEESYKLFNILTLHSSLVIACPFLSLRWRGNPLVNSLQQTFDKLQHKYATIGGVVLKRDLQNIQLQSKSNGGGRTASVWLHI